MKRFFGVGAVLFLVAAAGCVRPPTGPQRYTIDVDAASPKNKKLQFSAYFPGSVRVHAGDTVVFRNGSTEAPHTVTFGVKTDRSNQPQLLIPAGENPVAFQPCYSEDNPTPTLTTCPHKELPAFGGSGYWNSGLLQPAPTPDAAGAKQIVVELSKDIAPDVYTFVCVLHPFMNGSLDVVDEDADRPSTDDVVIAAQQARDAAIAQAVSLKRPQIDRDGNTVTMTAGWGNRVTAVNQFTPSLLDVEVGTTIRWVARSPYEPHTITFASPYRTPADPKSFVQGGIRSGSDYSGGFANSGLLGPKGGPFPSGPFTLTFTKAREYRYTCTLHPGMDAVLRVRRPVASPSGSPSATP